MTRVSLLVLTVILGLAGQAAAQERIGIADNDRVVFYGDETLAPPSAGTFVEQFVRARYPTSKARYWHQGTARLATIDRANREFDELIAPLQPTVIVLCWGLGEGDSKRHDPVTADRFAAGFEKLVDRCLSSGAKVFVLTPPCPTVSKKNVLKIAEYDHTVLKIAEAAAEVATRKGATVLDWYASTAKAQERGQGAELTAKNGLSPAPLSEAIATKLILDAWHLEPIVAEVIIDWEAKTVSSTHGKAEINSSTTGLLQLTLVDFPMPLYTGKRSAAFREEFACANYCQLMLKIDNLPDGQVVLSGSTARRLPRGLPSKTLADGYNLALASPLGQAEAVKNLAEVILKKNKAYSSMVRFRNDHLGDNAPDPELLESYKTYLRARQQYHEGMVKVLQRTNRLVDVNMVIHWSAAAPGR